MRRGRPSVPQPEEACGATKADVDGRLRSATVQLIWMAAALGGLLLALHLIRLLMGSG